MENFCSLSQSILKRPFVLAALKNDVFREISPPKCCISPSSAVTYSGTSMTPELGENSALSKISPGLFSFTLSDSAS